uniref:Cocaine- and amphetamine-regulated transcript protein n=1 Tax=Cyprinus carpio TaxID=7962 RepID=A0A8C1M749_CYPCA
MSPCYCNLRPALHLVARNLPSRGGLSARTGTCVGMPWTSEIKMIPKQVMLNPFIKSSSSSHYETTDHILLWRPRKLSASCRSLESATKTQDENNLIEALQEVLEKLQNKQLPQSGKKFSLLPSCDAGEQCAERKGARVGKFCDCPQGTSCHFFILKCL